MALAESTPKHCFPLVSCEGIDLSSNIMRNLVLRMSRMSSVSVFWRVFSKIFCVLSKFGLLSNVNCRRSHPGVFFLEQIRQSMKWAHQSLKVYDPQPFLKFKDCCQR